MTWNNSYADDYKDIFIKTLSPCSEQNWVECDRQFKGSNRSIFGMPIELDKSGSVKAKYINFVKNNYDSNCDTSKLIRQFVDVKKSNYSFKVSDFIKDNISIKEKKGFIAYMLDKNTVIILAPENGNYKILIPNPTEEAFRKSKQFRFYSYVRILNNIHNYNILKAKKEKLSCRKFVSVMNEALSPIAYQADNNNTNKEFYKKYMVRSASEIANFYFPLNTEKKILESLNAK